MLLCTINFCLIYYILGGFHVMAGVVLCGEDIWAGGEVFFHHIIQFVVDGFNTLRADKNNNSAAMETGVTAWSVYWSATQQCTGVVLLHYPPPHIHPSEPSEI